MIVLLGLPDAHVGTEEDTDYSPLLPLHEEQQYSQTIEK
jgi:hypothetical protein